MNGEGLKNPKNGGGYMQTKTKEADIRDRELDEELAGILSAISVVSKRLAKKLLTLQHQGGRKGEGGKADG